jgi:outer membrane protein assembly factor BamA
MPQPNAFPILLTCCLLSASLVAQCSSDHRSSKTGGVLIKDFTIAGTQTLSSTELDRITGELIGSCFNDDTNELGERIRASFQDRGYFAVEVKSVSFKALDPLGVPKPVAMEADVSEGLRYRLAEISFVDNHAFAAEKLRDAFPLKPGDLFERGKVATGLESVRKLYSTGGYMDAFMVPETQFGSNGTVSLKITVEEGPQYHMGKVDILAGRELAARLLAQWKLAAGDPYDIGYLDRYIQANRNLLPANFTRGDATQTQDCPNAQVNVRMVIDPDLEKSVPARKSVPCEDQQKPN